MSSNRSVVRAVVALTATLALLAGAAPAASAAAAGTGVGPRAGAGPTRTMTSAEHCAKERRDVKRAKKRLARARHADERRPAKVRRAKANLRKQKRQKATWCRRAADEAVTGKQADALKAAWSTLRTSEPVQALPDDIQKEMFGSVARVLGLVDSLKSEQVPGGSPEELRDVRALVAELAPGTIQAATADLVEKLETSTSRPDALGALIAALISGLPTGTVLPPDGDLAAMQKAMQDLVATLAAFEPSGGQPEVAEVVTAMEEATAAVQAASESGELEQLLTSSAEVNHETAPTSGEFAQLLVFLLDGSGSFPFPMPSDVPGLDALDTLLAAAGGLIGSETALPGAALLVPELTAAVNNLSATDQGTLGGVVDPGGVIGGIVGGLSGGLVP